MSGLIFLILSWMLGGGTPAAPVVVAPAPGDPAPAELRSERVPADQGTRGVTPCGDADFDRDGELDFIDVIIFLQLFSSTQPAADLDANGVYDYLDVLVFLQVFSAGC